MEIILENLHLDPYRRKFLYKNFQINEFLQPNAKIATFRIGSDKSTCPKIKYDYLSITL